MSQKEKKVFNDERGVEKKMRSERSSSRNINLMTSFTGIENKTNIRNDRYNKI